MSAAEQGLISYLDEVERRGKSDLEAGMINYLERKARQKGFPIRGIFELTPRCNLDCKMCYVHLSEAQIQATGRQVLTGEQWKHIMQQAIDAGMLYALLTGGEAMLHPDFDEIYCFLLSQGVQVNINTNGVLLTEERVRFFKQFKPKRIQITLYGENDIVYESVTGRKVFDQVIDAIRLVSEADIPYIVGITPNKYMQGNGKALVTLLEGMNVPYSINSGLFDAREETGRDTACADFSLDDYMDLYKWRASIHGEKLIKVREDDLLQVGGNSTVKSFGLRCSAGRSGFAVTWKGELQPCLMFSKVKGDLHQKAFSEAWTEVRNIVSNYPYMQECIGCAYEGMCPICVLVHEKGAPIGHANPDFCRRAMRMVQEGLAIKNACLIEEEELR